jgi:hypothetical protein
MRAFDLGASPEEIVYRYDTLQVVSGVGQTEWPLVCVNRGVAMVAHYREQRLPGALLAPAKRCKIARSESLRRKESSGPDLLA